MFSNESPLITDFYQFSMMQAYQQENMHDLAVFEFFVRPTSERNFYIAAGLEQVLHYLLNLKFSEQDIAYLKSTNYFNADFINLLKRLKFTGDVFAMPEGTIFFPNEPILQVIAPIIEAQLVESRIINILNLQTMIASKSIRHVLQAENKLLIDFGMRRAHGSEAALYSSRANFITGFHGTSMVAAGQLFAMPTFGTMAHSYIQAHNSEQEAFLAFGRSQPHNVVLLIDTYDVIVATKTVIEVAKQLEKENIAIKAVRIDSGDLHELSIQVRQMLDQANLSKIQIFVSGDLDEFMLEKLKFKNSPIDGYGIGTRLDTSADKPYLNCAYKLEEYAGKPRRKYSTGKITYPGRKQVFRKVDEKIDVLGLAQDNIQGAEKLLRPVITQGKLSQTNESLETIRQRVKKEMIWLPDKLKSLKHCEDAYPLEFSETLQKII